MSKKSNSGGSNMILLAGLGAGALLLFAGRSKAASPTTTELPAGAESASDIPDAPKILAVNTKNTESPLPTGVVSDEEGMEVTTGSSGTTSAPSGNSSWGKSIVKAGTEVIQQVQEFDEIPPLVSTKLTPKEKEIIDKGKLTAALAVKRPDLYKAAYIKRYGGKTQASKSKALNAATLAITTAVKAAQALKGGGLVKAVRYPAKPEHTFVQSAGGMSTQVAMTKMATLQKAGVKVSPAAQKVAAQVKATKASKGRHPVKSSSVKTAHPAKKKVKARPASPVKAKRPAKKKTIKKRH